MVDEDSLTENYKNQNSFVWVVKQYSFWIEMIIMLVCPLPFKIGGTVLHERIVTV